MAVNNLITLRKGIATEWSSQNPTLASGEPGYDGTNNVLKIGDGSTAWSSLPPANFPVDGLEGQILSKISDSSDTLQWIDNYANELRATVQNNTASDISLGTVVMATGASGDNIHVAPAVADGSVEAKYILGVAAETISSEGGLGYISVFGPLNNLNTNSYDVGTVLYIDPSAAGGWTATEPTSPNLAIPFAIVTSKNASAGRIFIRMWPQQEGLHELHDVNIDSAVNGDGIKYNSSNDTWIPDTDIVHGTGTQNYVAVWTSDQLLTSGIIYDDGTNVGIGTASPVYKLDVAGSGSFDALNINDQFTFPTTDGSANQYLKTDGLGNVTWSTIAGGGGGIDGTGIANYVSKWADSDSLTSGIIYDDGTNVGIGTNSPSSKLDVDGTIETRALIGSLSVLQISNSNGGIELYSTTGDFSVRCNQFRPIQVDLQSDLQAAFLKLNDSENDIDLIHYQDGPTSLPNIYSDAGLAKVAIGHDSPSYKLDINGDIGLTDSGFYASPTGVMVGTSGWLYNDGQTTLSHGNFTDNGDAQNSSYVLRTSTTNDTFTTIANNGSSIRLSNNRTFMFTANIVARRTNGQDNAAYKLEGIIANDGYGAGIRGTPVKTILYESDSSWDIQAIITSINVGDSTSDNLLIQGKGAASKNINWVCKLDLLEVGGDITGYTESNALGIQENIIP